jgi:hypothetical protein
VTLVMLAFWAAPLADTSDVARALNGAAWLARSAAALHAETPHFTAHATLTAVAARGPAERALCTRAPPSFVAHAASGLDLLAMLGGGGGGVDSRVDLGGLRGGSSPSMAGDAPGSLGGIGFSGSLTLPAALAGSRSHAALPAGAAGDADAAVDANEATDLRLRHTSGILCVAHCG